MRKILGTVLWLAAASCRSSTVPGPHDAAASVLDVRPPGEAAAPDVAPIDVAKEAAPTATAPTPAAERPNRTGLQYNGAVALFHPRTPAGAQPRLYTFARAGDAGAPGEWLEISAPIWPKVLRLYQNQGDNYPSTDADRRTLARESALTFDYLLGACREQYPEITVKANAGPEPTAEQVARNYGLLARCAYERFTAKPYWIPQLLIDIDVCNEAMGPSWRMLTEDDVRAISTADNAAMQESLSAASSGIQNASFYFALATWVRMNDGSVKGGSLQPGSAFTTPTSFDSTPYDPRVHHEGAFALRCLRQTVIE
jgi:hypothetical protein